MKILAISDIHSEDEVLDKLKSAVVSHEYECLVIAGDITHNGPVSFAHDLIYDLELIGMKTYAVVGNMDPPEVLAKLEGADSSIHLKKVSIGGGWSLAGFGGSLAGGAHTPTEFTEEEIYKGLSSLAIDSKTILVTHAPPQGVETFDITDKGVAIGSKSIRRIVEEKKPAVLVCGHVHETQGIARLGETIIVKLGPAYEGKAAVLELNGKIKATLIEI